MKIRRWILILVCLGVVLGGVVFSWVMWGAWPVTTRVVIPWEPEVIVVLGGGNEERAREALRLAAVYSGVPLLVTGDGGTIHRALLDGGIPASRLSHEARATSTVENARFTDEYLDEMGISRALLVTNSFHVPRALAVFQAEQPDREFAASFEPPPGRPTNWHVYCQRRERLAALLYVFRYGIWSF